MKRVRAILTYGLAIPAFSLAVAYGLIPKDASRMPLGLRFYGLDPAVRASFGVYTATADTLRVHEAALRRMDSHDRAMSARAHRGGLLVRGDSGVPSALEALVLRLAAAELEAIGAAEPRYPIAIIVMVDARLSYPPFQRAVVLPREAGAPCTVVLRIGSRGLHFKGVGNTDRLLGTCGFYAAHGPPGEGMRDWLSSTRLAAAGFLQRPASHGDGIVRDPAEANASGSRLDMAACRAGRLDGCERLFTEPRDQNAFNAFAAWREIAAPPTPPGVLITGPGEFGSVSTGISAGLLASIAADLGPERFRRIWSSNDAPVEAFARNEGRPLAAWIQERVNTAVRVYHAGPSVGAAQWVSLLVLLLGSAVLGVRLSRVTLA